MPRTGHTHPVPGLQLAESGGIPVTIRPVLPMVMRGASASWGCGPCYVGRRINPLGALGRATGQRTIRTSHPSERPDESHLSKKRLMRNVQTDLEVRREALPELMLDSGGEASDVRPVFVLTIA